MDAQTYIATYPDGSPRTWEDGSPRSWNNVFTTHGYVVGAPIAPTPRRNTKRGPRSVMAFASPDGVIPGMGDRMPRKNQPRLARRSTEPA